MQQNQDPVDGATRIFGWIIAIIYLFGSYMVTSWIDGLNLPTFLLVVLGLIFGLFSFVGFMFLNMQFDLFYDRPERDDG